MRDVDGKTGPMTLNGKPYDLAQGPSFLVATKGGEVRVLQLKRETLKLKAGNQSLEGLLKDDPDVEQFFARAQTPK